MAIKDKAASVLVNLKNQAREIGVSYQICVQLFCQEEFLRKVEKSSYFENFILKGGMLIYTLTEFDGRPTRDIDFMVRWLSNETSSINQVMEEICVVNTGNDFIKMEVLGSEDITEDQEYHGVKTKFRAYIKNVQIPFSIDVGIDDIVIPGIIKRTISTRLNQFHPPTIYTYSLESTISEKFDAIIKRMEATSRMKDFFDIYYLSSMFEFEGEKLQEAIFKTLEHRGTNYSSESFERIKAFKESAFLLNLWNNYESGTNDKKLEFSIIIDRLEEFLEPVFNAVVNKTEFLASWSNTSNSWIV